MFRPSGGHHQVVHSEVEFYYNVLDWMVRCRDLNAP